MKALRWPLVGVMVGALVAGSALAQTRKVNLEVWIYEAFAAGGDKAPIAQLAREFMSLNRDINITLIPNPPTSTAFRDKFMVAAQAGGGPDVIMSDIIWSPQLAAMGLALPIDNYVGAGKNDFYPGPLETLTYQGKLYGLPFYTNALGLIYNKTAFEKAGLPLPKDGWTWNDFMNAVKKLSVDGKYGFGFQGNWGGTFEWFPWLWQNGGQLLSADNTRALFNSPASVEAVETFLGLVTNKTYVPEAAKTWKTWDEMAAAFASGTIAMYQVGDWGLSGVDRLKPNFEWGVAPLPMNKQKASVVGGANWMINAKTKNPDAAWRWMRYVTGPKVYGLLDPYNRLAARKGSLTGQQSLQNNPRLQAFANLLKNGKARPAIPNWTQLEYDCLQPAFQSVLLKGAEVKKVMAEAEACANKILAK
jgi:multiple sugar transport system substrate-binding protein